MLPKRNVFADDVVAMHQNRDRGSRFAQSA